MLVNVAVLGQALEIDVDCMVCEMCRRFLDPVFVTLRCNHYLCVGCGINHFTQVGDTGCYMCPTCSTITLELLTDPFVSMIMATTPRRMPCGVEVAAFDAAMAHGTACAVCLRAANLGVPIEIQNTY